MSSVTTVTTGKRGEEIAVDYLSDKGYFIICRNYRWNRGEIDIIAQKKDILVFVEVKTARRMAFGNPETWVDEKKQQQIGMVAEHYMDKMTGLDIDCRFDVIAITMHQNSIKIKHVEDAFWL